MGVFITKSYKEYRKIIEDIDFKMMRKDEKIWIKAIPLTQKSKPSSIFISIDNIVHCWNIYDESGRNNHKIYLKGGKILPRFFLKLEEKNFRINFNNEFIKVVEISEIKDIPSYVKNNCNLSSSCVTCWAIDMYHTNDPENYPFDIM